MSGAEKRTPEQRLRDRRERQKIAEKAQFTPPSSIDDALVQLGDLDAEIQIVNGQLQSNTVETSYDNRNFVSWRKSAIFSIRVKKARRALLRAWIERERTRFSTIKKLRKGSNPDILLKLTEQNFEPPSSLVEAERGRVELKSQVLRVQTELNQLDTLGLSKDEFGKRRTALVAISQPLLSRQTFLKTWLKLERIKQADQIRARRNDMAVAMDPDDPLSLIFHAHSTICQLLRQTGTVSPSNEWDLADCLRAYLRRHNLSE